MFNLLFSTYDFGANDHHQLASLKCEKRVFKKINMYPYNIPAQYTISIYLKTNPFDTCLHIMQNIPADMLDFCVCEILS